MFKKKSVMEKSKNDWRENGSFVHKPVNGWHHSEETMNVGVAYSVKYVGCAKILESMRTTSSPDRGLVVKEAIMKCCDKAGLLRYRKKESNHMKPVVGDVYVGSAGEEAVLLISKRLIDTTITKSGLKVCTHNMNAVSFASAGEGDYRHMVAYVSKDAIFERACFVFDCTESDAQAVIHTLGQAFELKYKDYLEHPPQAATVPERFTEPIFGTSASSQQPTPATAASTVDGAHGLDYSRLEHRSVQSNVNGYSTLAHRAMTPTVESVHKYDKLKLNNAPNGNLQFATGATYYDPFGQSTFAAVYDNPIAGTSTKPLPPKQPRRNDDGNPPPSPLYDNPMAVLKEINAANEGLSAVTESPYDNKNINSIEENDEQGYLIPISPGLQPEGIYDRPTATGKDDVICEGLSSESWFMGRISRVDAEKLIKQDGEFLVRQSTSTDNQYVLTGMQDGKCRHLLLIDPLGKVRTKDHQFDTITELIDFHQSNGLSIVSGGNEVTLKSPVCKEKPKLSAQGSFKI